MAMPNDPVTNHQPDRSDRTGQPDTSTGAAGRTQPDTSGEPKPGLPGAASLSGTRGAAPERFSIPGASAAPCEPRAASVPGVQGAPATSRPAGIPGADHAPAPPSASSDPHQRYGKPDGGWRARLYAVIFESDTRAGRLFDLALIGAILLSVAAVVLSSIEPVARRHGRLLLAAEWLFTIVFTVEYIGRLLCVKRPDRYARSFFGVIDLLAILPSYISLFIPQAHVLLDIRILRLLRMFRILKLTLYIDEYGMLGRALLASRRKILVFLSVVMLIVFLLGTVMYVVEGPAHGYTSIPTAVYWAISTVTTVGFGDLVPKTDLGRTVASLMMLLGWGILAVPTGIISSEITHQRGSGRPWRQCPACGGGGHEAAAKYCKDCGAALEAGR